MNRPDAWQLPPQLRQSLFVAGTDTGIGKTVVAAGLLRELARAGHRAAGMKPVAAGADHTPGGLRNEDALALAAAGNVALPYELVNPVCLPEATSPHLAARSAGRGIDLAMIRSAFEQIQQRSDVIVAEGAGGWLAPVGEPGRPGEPGPTMQEVALVLGLPVVLVVGLKLGCINHALLSAGAVSRSGLPLVGWIANPSCSDFADVERYVESLRLRMPCPLLWRFPRSVAAG